MNLAKAKSILDPLGYTIFCHSGDKQSFDFCNKKGIHINIWLSVDTADITYVHGLIILKTNTFQFPGNIKIFIKQMEKAVDKLLQ